MRTRQPTATLEDQRIPVRVKLAAAWTSVMFLYVYVDILAFFKPGVINGILAGKVWEYDVSQTLLTTFLALMAIPIFMVVVSMTLPARAARITNLMAPTRSTRAWAEINIASSGSPNGKLPYLPRHPTPTLP